MQNSQPSNNSPHPPWGEVSPLGLPQCMKGQAMSLSSATDSISCGHSVQRNCNGRLEIRDTLPFLPSQCRWARSLIWHGGLQEAAQASERAMVVQFLKPVKQAIDAALEAYQAELQPVQR